MWRDSDTDFMTKLEQPRWIGGPMHCPAANLPAFANAKEAAKFRDANSPGTTVIAEWVYTACGWIHFWSHAVGPSGASSGTTRLAKHIDSFPGSVLQVECG